jgi:hypothetical protein
MSIQFTAVQRKLIAAVEAHPNRFTRSGLAKMLVGADSWQDKDYREYGSMKRYGRKDLTFEIDILLQQGFLALDSRQRLVIVGEGE